MKLTKFFISTVIFSGLAINAKSFAFENSAEEKINFEQVILSAQDKCPNLQCVESEVQLQKLSYQDIKELSKETRESLRNAGKELAQNIWPDTILEGPFYVLFNVRMDRIEKITYKNNFIGWRISYSDQAWDIESCSFSEENLDSLKECHSGRIIESGFVSADFKDMFRDDTAYATFQD